MELVVAPQSCQGSQADGVGEEYLRACINPHLKKATRTDVRPGKDTRS